MNECYSLADIAAVNGNNNNGFGGENGAWWIILFLIFAAFGGGWGNGFGGFGGGGGAAENYVLASDFATIQRQLSDGFNSIDNALDRQNAGICDLGYTALQLNNQLATQIADCCCKTQTNIADLKYTVGYTGADISRQISDTGCNIERQIERGFNQTNYNMANNHCQTLQAIDKVGDRVIDYLANEKMQNLRDENMALRLSASQAAQNAYLVNELRPCPIPAYITCNPFANTNYVNGCGCVQ